ncbi:MAG: OmpA family protein, partial [Comamonadaceae bacterium]
VSVTTATTGAASASAAPVVAVVTETVSVVIPDGASVRVDNGVVKFYFASGSADLAPGAAEALAAVIKGVEGGRKAVVSGFHDTTGDPAINEQLAKKRAEMVRDVLTGLGVPAAKVDVQKPAVTAGSGNDAQARRVEVKLLD